jgi:glycosyltransferase involved in cell wall biosynthesis
MKIVLYNYVQPNEKNAPGGGVTIYLRNLSSSLREEGHEVFTLSAGDRYSIINNRAFVKHSKNSQEFIIYNSPNVAPAQYSFYHNDIYSTSAKLNKIPSALKTMLGDIDVFHFHNIEGLTKDFFISLYKEFPKAALIYSAHNYNAICPQVNLWQHNLRSCADFNNGYRCIGCSGTPDKRILKILINIIKTPIKELIKYQPKLVSKLYDLDRFLIKKINQYRTKKAALAPIKQGNEYPTTAQNPQIARTKNNDRFASSCAIFRSDNIHLINNCFDKVLAVSRRTRDIFISLGATNDKFCVSYIGTKHHEKLVQAIKKHPTPGNIHIGYIGYMRRLKGFYFFLDVIECLPTDILAQIEITVAAKFDDPGAVKRLNSLGIKRLRLFDGYNQQDLPDILNPVNLGIVPPLWEDNLPQVAIEFIAHGIPILTSNMGGAQEIVDNSDYVFTIDNIDDLVGKICSIHQGKFDFSGYWNTQLNIKSNRQHAAEILSVYESILQEKRVDRVIAPAL